MIYTASFCESRPDGSTVCRLCAHQCTIAPGKKGICGVRRNDDGNLKTLVYGHTLTTSADPIEKKPLYHMLPGSQAFSIATAGCNMQCRFCQNWQISQMPRQTDTLDAVGCAMSPEEVVVSAGSSGCASIAYTYTEPTIYYEYARDCGIRAKEAGIKNIFVTNGYMLPAVIDEAAAWLDAANVDLKAFSDGFYRKLCGARLQPVLDSIRRMRERGVWVEVTTLLIPGENDDPAELEGMAAFLAETDPDMPWHISRYHPDFQFDEAPATPLECMEKAYRIGRDAGIKHVYLGNVPEGGDTVCPGCGAVLVERNYYATRTVWETAGTCPGCGERIAGIW